MARKSQWEQFADNFTTFYDIGNKFQKGLATRKIMGEDPVEIESTIQEGPRNQYSRTIPGGKWTYGGKTYDKEITAEELKGLRNERIADAYTRFGDHDGAMKMRLDAANLRGLSNQAKLDEGTLKENIKKVRLENQLKIANMRLTDAERTHIKKLEPHQVAEYLAKLDKMKVETAHKKGISKYEIANAKALSETNELTLQDRIADQVNIDLERGITETELRLKSDKVDYETKVFKSTYEDRLATDILASGEARNEAEAKKLASDRNLEGNKTLSLFATEMGEGGELYGKDAVAQQAWLTKHWRGDKAVGELLNTIGADNLERLTQEGSRTMAEVKNAISNKSPKAAQAALIKVIDMQDGIEGNMKFDTIDGNLVLLENGKPVITSDGVAWSKFTEALHIEFTPLKSLEIAKSNADIRYVNAQSKFKESEAGMKVTLAESKAWGDHTQTDHFRQIAQMSAEEFKKTTGFDLMDDYAKDYIARMRTATGTPLNYQGDNKDYSKWSSSEIENGDSDPTINTNANAVNANAVNTNAVNTNAVNTNGLNNSSNNKLNEAIIKAEEIVSTDLSGLSGHNKKNTERRKEKSKEFLSKFKTAESTQKYIDKLKVELTTARKKEKTDSGHSKRNTNRQIKTLLEDIKDAESYKRGIALGNGS